MNLNNNARHKRETFGGLNDELINQAREMSFVVFLCGPSSSGKGPSANLRKRIKKALEKELFPVVLGEDDGLVELSKRFHLDAQTNELCFIKSPECRVVILIADSVGSYCELGLFNWHFADDSNEYFDKNKMRFHVIADKKFKRHKSYFNEGPIKTLKAANGNVDFSDFTNFDVDKLIDELKSFRALKIKPYPGGDK